MVRPRRCWVSARVRQLKRVKRISVFSCFKDQWKFKYFYKPFILFVFFVFLLQLKNRMVKLLFCSIYKILWYFNGLIKWVGEGVLKLMKCFRNKRGVAFYSPFKCFTLWF